MAESAIDLQRDHPAYAGHFPGRPILPAVVLVAEALAGIERDTGHGPAHWTLGNAKFPRPVEPGTPLTLAHEPTPAGLRFEIRSPGGIVASGTLAPRE
ncbi:MAG TPA: hypothetical protein VFK48_04835 [Usitatibacter sp.]|nr:hypothetical protein [Usitatibacter sp.]